MTLNVNWALLGAIASWLAGAAGTIITAVYGAHLAVAVQTALQTLSALLIAIPTFHVSSTAAYNAKAKIAAKMGLVGSRSVPSL